MPFTGLKLPFTGIDGHNLALAVAGGAGAVLVGIALILLSARRQQTQPG